MPEGFSKNKKASSGPSDENGRKVSKFVLSGRCSARKKRCRVKDPGTPSFRRFFPRLPTRAGFLRWLERRTNSSPADLGNRLLRQASANPSPLKQRGTQRFSRINLRDRMGASPRSSIVSRRAGGIAMDRPLENGLGFCSGGQKAPDPRTLFAGSSRWLDALARHRHCMLWQRLGVKALPSLCQWGGLGSCQRSGIPFCPASGVRNPLTRTWNNARPACQRAAHIKTGGGRHGASRLNPE